MAEKSTTLPSIAVLGGTGDQGQGLALRWSATGYHVTIGSRSLDRAKTEVDRLNAKYEGVDLRANSNRGAAADADIVVLTVPFKFQKPTVDDVSSVLRGKILVDVTVPLVPPKVTRVQLPESGSAVVGVQRLLGDTVRVVSAFQNVSAHHLKDLDKKIDCDVLVCGDDVGARETTIMLARAAGMRGIHGGPLQNSVVSEALTSVLIGINKRYKSPGAGIQITGIPSEADIENQN